VEPFHSSINEELSQFPDEIEITQQRILDSYTPSWGFSSIRLRDIICEKARELGLSQIEKSYYDVASHFFEIQVKDLNEGDDVIIDFETGVLSHKILLVKTKIGFDDSEL